MILTSDRATYINVFKAEFKPKLSVVQIGTIRYISDCQWVLKFTGRNALGNATLPTYYSDLLNHSEKRQIIGTLDKLNDTGPTAESDMRSRWRFITGLSSWTDIVLEGIKADKDWSDIVEDVETMLKER